jgi:hypothetical protein
VLVHAVPNVIAMVTSVAAIVAMLLVVRRIGGEVGLMFRLIAGGVFVAVFLHAGSELARLLELVSEQALMPVMGVLLSAGSIAFFAAAVVGLRALR